LRRDDTPSNPARRSKFLAEQEHYKAHRDEIQRAILDREDE
jgi:hypothetical protein